MRGRLGVGADSRDVDERRAGGACRARHGFGARGHHRIEALAAVLEQDADQIDDDIGVVHRRRDRIRITQIGLHGVDLADAAHRLQMEGEIGAAHRDADAVAAVGERAHHVAAEKTRTAEYRNERFKLVLRGHLSRNT